MRLNNPLIARMWPTFAGGAGPKTGGVNEQVREIRPAIDWVEVNLGLLNAEDLNAGC